MSRYSSNADATLINSLPLGELPHQFLPLPLGEGRGEGAFPSETNTRITTSRQNHAAPNLSLRESDNPTYSLSLWESAGVRVPSAARQTRTAFTLVELLVVIGILSILAALVTPAIFQARVSARNAAIKAEIDMLHMAIMNYKNEYGSFPPCNQPNTAVDGPAVRHLRRIFPRVPAPTNEFVQSGAGDGIDNDGDGAIDEAGESFQVELTPNKALIFWLEGYSNLPTTPRSQGKPQKLYDWDASRYNNITGEYHPSGKPGSPYIYIDANEYTSGSPAAIQNFVAPGGPYFAQRLPLSGNFGVVSQEAFNPDTFQILCAGLDEQWGTEDDLSNFWPGTRQDYLDSLE